MFFRSVSNFFWKNIYREFSPFKMEISPFIFFRSVLNFFFWKTNSTDNFLHSEWRNLRSEWRFSPFLFFFRSVLNFKKKISTENFLHLKWRNLHSEWRFLHSNVVQKRLELFLKKISTENFLPFKKLKWRNLHSEWRFLYSNVFQKRFELFFEKQTPQIVFSIQNGEISILNGDFSIYFFQTCTVFWTFFWKKNSTESFLRSEWRNLHSEWRFLHSHVSQKCSVF